MILKEVSSQVAFPLFNPVFSQARKRKNHPLVSKEMRRPQYPYFPFFPPLIPKAWLKTISLFQFAQTLWESWCTLEKGSNSPLKVLLAVIKPNEKMRCKESQFRVHLNYKVLFQSGRKYWELLLLTTFSFGKL